MPVFADVNGDGFIDLAAFPRLGDGAHVWLGDGKGAWRDSSKELALPFSCGGGLAFGDFGKLGRLDLAAADHCAGVFVYRNAGQGSWEESAGPINPLASNQKSSADGEEQDEENELQGGEAIAAGDVNGDGFIDLAVASSMEGGITVYFGDGSGRSWTEAESDGLPKSGFADKIMLKDIDGDGHLDVFASYSDGPRVWKGDGKGNWQDYSQGLPISTAGGRYRGIAAGDVNEDGRLDLAVAHILNGPEIFLQSSGGTWQQTAPLQSALKGGATAVALGDLDGDGHVDLVAGGSQTESDEYGLFVFQGDGKAGWTGIEGTELPSKELIYIWGIALADVNGDGLLDMAVTTGGSPPKRQKSETLPRMQVWLNQFRKGIPKS
ncbi:MAG: VCBS repeat-containing protein [Beijerinckiaceae bacterium]|nr:VCBS repeat-containing protein [Beijerinckiaceae bacterium]